MAGNDNREVTTIKGRHLRFLQPLTEGNHCGVDESQIQVVVPALLWALAQKSDGRSGSDR